MASFDKYHTISPDYHYRQIDWRSLRTFSAPVLARFEDLVEKVREAAGDRGLKLLDVGCGDGVALYLISKALPELQLSGIDLVEEALEIAKTKVPQTHFAEGLAHALPYPDESFDIVISSDVIEHVEDADKMLSEIKRVAKTNATIIIGTPIKLTKKPLDHNHTEEFFPEDLMGMMGKHFREPKLFETHNLAYMLFYNAPTHSFLNFKYLVNLLFWIFGWNPFKKGRENRVQLFAYMTVVCKK